VSVGRSLDERLAAARIDPAGEPFAAWCRLRAAEGPRATVIDLYALVAARRGLEPHELPQAERLALARSAMPVVWPGFTTTGAGAPTGSAIVVVDYDDGWPARFEEWRARIAETLGETARRIEHVGSTSVPGLPAKPIVDIQVSVADPDEASYVPGLERTGLQLRSRDELHRFFRPTPGRPRDVNVHVCAAGSDWERDHLLFRDYLRGHEEARRTYAEAKRAAASVWSDDGYAYTDAKTDVILAIMDAAERASAS
jgi:GrpB-like predicted nucleotidyltransferase (UPF0157 family)